MAEINLLNSDSEARASLQEAGKRWILRIATLALVAVLVLYGYLFISSRTLEKNIADDKAAIGAFENSVNSNKQRQELLTRQGQLKSVNTLIKNHLSWSYLLPELARVTVQTAKYSNIIASETGDLDVTVVVPSYADADKYLQVFNLPEYNAQFSNVRIVSLVRGQIGDGLQTMMRLKLTYNPEFLKK